MKSGHRLGSYEILAPLGAGGMGEVYRAKDLRLDREVAVKMLSPRVAASPDHLARFEREARALATLNHPHVATLYGVERFGDAQFLVLELIEGQTLEQRLGYGPLEMKEALALALQIATALEAAHASGIIHRDLKPSNVMIGSHGEVKLVDFGLSRLIRPALDGEIPHDLSITTRSGVILGTAPYMSPEQASGRPVDARTDVWSFGCLLYEMLTGTRPFKADSGAGVIAAILEREPNWTLLPPETPEPVRRLLRRCLRKSIDQRLQSIGDARIELEEVDSVDDTPSARAPVARRWAAALPWAGLVVMVLLATQWMRRETPSSNHLVTRATLVLPEGHSAIGFSRSYPLALSSDGRRLAYVASVAGETRLFVQSLEDAEARAVSSSVGARFPFFSPDGEWVGFWADGWLQKVPFDQGRPVRIAKVPALDYGATWGPDDTIIFAEATRGFGEERGGLQRISAQNGSVQRLVSDEWLMYPRFLPDGKHVVVTRAGSRQGRTIQILDLDSGTRHDVLSVPENPRQAFVLPSGYLVWGSGGSVHAARIDLKTFTLTGSPARVLDDVFEGTSADAVYFAVADDGTLLFVPGGTDHSLVVVDRSGRAQPLTARRAAFRLPDLSPDGRMLAVAIDADPNPSDIWLYDLTRGTWRRLTNQSHNLFPLWTPDGGAVAVKSWRRGTGEPLLAPLDGGPPEPLLPADSLSTNNRWPQSWSPDGGRLVFGDHDPETGFDLWLLDRVSGEPVRPLLVTPFNEWSARISPDGRWLVYASDETGRYEIYVRSFPDAGNVTPISSNGGIEPRWSSDGKEIFFLSGNRMMAVEVDSDDGLVAGEPRKLFEGNYGTGDRTYAVFPDASRFLMIQPDPRSAADRFELVLGWSSELDRATR